ncbi:MAG: dihydroneopterin aldolase family protein [Methanobacteriaceae archaeon]|nr:dihydroneopterin aldolase family protein [Methanobacteriaceae archaeon]
MTDINKYFKNITSKERAIFEAGISLGALYHQFIGTPISIETVQSLEKTIKESITLQPCITDVKINIDKTLIKTEENKLGYSELQGEMLNIKLTSQYKDETIIAKLEYIPKLQYPLMYIE